MRMHRLFINGIAALIVGWCAAASVHARQGQSQPLVDAVRAAIQPFSQTASAEDAGYMLFAGCVAGPQEGAMGVHYVNVPLIGDGAIDERHPEALVYEPRNGRLQLVAAEFIVIAAQWDAAHPGPENAPPTLMGQMFHYVGSPNRYRLPPFYELHVWAEKLNPSGAFADWNPHVSCETFEPSH
jgi:hypothetical protein